MTRTDLVVLFPGQGSQAIGMLSALAAAHPAVRATFDEASAAIDLDLWSLSQEGPETELNRTLNTQPALLAAGVAVWPAAQAIRNDAARPIPASQKSKLLTNGPLAAEER